MPNFSCRIWPINHKQKGAKGDDPEDTFERFLERFGELTQDIDRVSQNVEELRTLQGEVLRAVHRDEAVDVKMDNLNAENKRLGKKIRNVLNQSKLNFFPVKSFIALAGLTYEPTTGTC